MWMSLIWVKTNILSWEQFRIKTRFDTEAKASLEMAYWTYLVQTIQGQKRKPCLHVFCWLLCSGAVLWNSIKASTHVIMLQCVYVKFYLHLVCSFSCSGFSKLEKGPLIKPRLFCMYSWFTHFKGNSTLTTILRIHLILCSRMHSVNRRFHE